MPIYEKGTIAFTVEDRKGQLTVVASWTISVDDLNKLLCEKFEQAYSRDVIWKVVKSKANQNRGTQHRVRKKLPSHMGVPNTRKEKKAAAMFMVDVVAKHLNRFDLHIEKFLAAEREEVAARTSPTFRDFVVNHYLVRFIDSSGERSGTYIRRISEFQNWVWPVIGHMRLDEIKAKRAKAATVIAKETAAAEKVRLEKAMEEKALQ